MDTNHPNAHEAELREQDRWLPIANVARLMKNTLPVTAKVSKDAKECMQECVSEFISFITSEASDRCLKEKRKTINGEDILYSMHDLGFENYAEVLKIYLAKYREQQALKQERNETRATKRQKKSNTREEGLVSSNTQDEQSSSNSPMPREYVSAASEDMGSSHYLETEQSPNHNEDQANLVANINALNGSNGSTASSINSPESFFQSYESTEPDMRDHVNVEGMHSSKEIKEEQAEHENGNLEKQDVVYRYDTYISDPTVDGIGTQPQISELTKDLAPEDQNIHRIDSGIANESSNSEYF